MGTRIELQAVLEDVLGSSAVYFQPPASIRMTYPCIVYKRDGGVTNFANNYPYRHVKRYLITVISKDPDFSVFDSILGMQTCVFDRSFASDGLHHYVYTIHF